MYMVSISTPPVGGDTNSIPGDGGVFLDTVMDVLAIIDDDDAEYKDKVKVYVLWIGRVWVDRTNGR